MGLLQKAYETYEAHEKLVGVQQEGLQMLAPIGHMLTRMDVEITINAQGEFVSARLVDKKEPKIVIPVTEDSMGRTSAPCPHPLCDQIAYLADYDEKKRDLYESQLEGWVKSKYSDDKLSAVLKYIQGNTIVQDLKKSECIEVKENGCPKEDKLMVAWRFVGFGTDDGGCYKDKGLFEKYSMYYLDIQENKNGLDMISGQMVSLAKQHAKGVVSLNGNAKLISANDKTNFTFRGRFFEDGEALSVGYEASQKAHNALSWLVSNQGVFFGQRTFLCWCPEGKKIPTRQIMMPLALQPGKKIRPSDYKKELRSTIIGLKKEWQLQGNETAVISAFDAATTGRLAVTYYNETSMDNFLEKMRSWDETCCWISNKYGTSSPSLQRIIECAFGIETEEKGKKTLAVSDKVKGLQLERLIASRLSDGKIPQDIVMALVNNAQNPLKYEECYSRVIFTACAVIRKYRMDKYKEVWDMAFEENREDRSYQYGALLALLDKAERDVYRKMGEELNSKRQTNAMRMQAVFSKRPENTSRILLEQIKNAYYPHLPEKARIFYEKKIGKIYDILSHFELEELNKPLSDTYLMGYYLMKNELHRTNEEKEMEDEV